MKIIPKSSIELENSILLFATRTGSKLWRLGIDQYAIYKSNADEPTIAFESEALSYIIDPITDGISDIAIIGCNCALCEETHLFVEIRILLKDGTSYYVDSGDNTVEVSNVEFAARDDSPAPTPCKHWSLPEEAPHKNMFVTNTLAKRISKTAENTNIEDVMQRMWLESHHLKRPHLINKVVKVNGEFLDYYINELRCGRVLFMTKNEICTYAPNLEEI